MPKDPTIEEVREVIEGLERHYSSAINEYPASVIRYVISQIKRAAEPKPTPAVDVLKSCLHSPLSGPDARVMAFRLIDDLEDEGYRIVHESEA